MNSPSKMTRLLMTRYSVSKQGTIQLETTPKFEVQINPADFKHSYGITYDLKAAQGAFGIDPKFSAVEAEKVTFSFVLDGTGVVPPVDGQPVDVKGQLQQLHKVVYEYVDTTAEPPRVRLLWGTLIFFGRLQTLSAQYTLFRPNGDPLRAKVDLSFVGAMSKEEEKLISYRASPTSQSQVVTAAEGDTVQQMCERMYGEQEDDEAADDLCMKVARYNGLTDLRKLEPGTRLVFPPLG
jgi:hypothetical protein